MEFDIPVSMAELCSQVPEDGTAALEWRKMLECTVLLATALRRVTSHQMSKTHANKYTRNMRGCGGEDDADSEDGDGDSEDDEDTEDTDTNNKDNADETKQMRTTRMRRAQARMCR
jgi:hypothetical protein